MKELPIEKMEMVSGGDFWVALVEPWEL